MRKLESLCRKFNRLGNMRICVLKKGRGQYFLRWYAFGESSFGSPCMKFTSVKDCISYVESLFR